MTTTHPEFQAEQAYVSRAYDLLDQGLADAEVNLRDYQTPHRSTAQAMKRALDILRNSRGSGQLVFGRVDQADQQPLYIGRRRVYDPEKNLVVVGWHAPAAQAYYEATPVEPGDVLLKRVFVEEDRRLRSVLDEITRSSLAAALSPEPPAISDALLRELERSRDGAMREVVSTIQAEQFRIIRAAADGVLVVQGGPGTGKSVIGLHRAAWLAFNQPELRRRGMLVVAPSTAFLSYVSGVLPSLDVTDIHQVDIGSMYPGEAQVSGQDDVETARVKGTAAMAEVLRRALRNRIGWDGDELQLSLGADVFRIPGAEVRALVEEVRRRDISHSDGRELLRQSLSALAYRRYTEHQREVGRPVVANESTIRRLSAFVNAIDRIWPTFTPEEFLRSLYSTQTWLTEASEGVLTADERARLFRAARPSIGDEAWTPADLACLDELSRLISDDVVTYGHVVIDEAQDLSPMQARALARRCPDGAFTLLGDLAQATGPWIRDSWEELTTHLDRAGSRVETLSIGYRVPGQVLDLASRLLPLIGPGLTAPTSIRRGFGSPTVIRVPAEELAARAIETAVAAVDAAMTTALLVPDERYDELLTTCQARGLQVGDGRDGDFAHRLTVVPAGGCKGLEFDSVVLLAPDEIANSGPDGRRLLYIALTRCTQEVVLVHTSPLPEGLDELEGPPPLDLSHPVAVPGLAAAEASASTGDLITLIDGLSAADRLIVEQLVRRLSVPTRMRTGMERLEDTDDGV